MHGELGQLSKPGSSMPGHEQVADHPQITSQLPHRSRTGFRHGSCRCSHPSARWQRTDGVRALGPPQAGGASQDRAAGGASPQLCRGIQAICSHLCHLRGDMASLRPHRALETQKSSAEPRGLQPFACQHQGKIPQGKQKSMVAFTAAWSTRTCFPPAACEISKKLLQTATRSHGLSHALKAAEALAVPQHLQSTAL